MRAGHFKAKGAAGFTLLEILMTIGLLALVVVVAYPGWRRSGIKEKAQKIKEDLEQIEQAVIAVAKERKSAPDAMIPFEEYRKHLRKGSILEKTGADPFGNLYGPQRADSRPTVPKNAAEQARDVVGDKFWEPFVVGQ